MSEQSVIRTLRSGNKSVRNLRGQGSSSRASSKSLRVSRIEAAARISDSEVEDGMEIETEHAVAYSHDNTAEPSMVIHSQLESPDITPRPPRASGSKIRSRTHPYSHPASRPIEEPTMLPPVTSTSDPEH